MDFLLSSLLLFVLGLLLFYLKFSYFPFQVLERNGIKGPPPTFFYGNYKELAKRGFVKFLEHIHKRYGPIVGFYWGIRHYITITDIDLIKQITVKDFDNFINRTKAPDLFGKPGEERTRGLSLERDDDWKVSRQTLSPTFSSSKMKAMTPLIHNSVKTLVEIFKEHANTGKSVEFSKIYGAFTMETIFATAFGRVIDIQRNESDKLTEAAAVIFGSVRENEKTSPLGAFVILNNFPWILPIFQLLAQQSAIVKSYHLFKDTATSLIKQRRAETEPGRYKDLLQLMIDATVEPEEGSDKGGDKQSTNSKRKLTDQEITAHAIQFMLAGYETTSSALTYVSYLLALNPHIQEKLQEEIVSYFEEHPEASLYQAAQELDYLDMVLQESLRLLPPAPLYDRECKKSYTYKDITIPEGTSLFISSIVLHKDPQYWEEPEKFDPLRFTAEEKAKRPQLCYMPFGAGPRSCIGMRFAILEAKIALIELLKDCTFVQAPDTEVPLELALGATMAPKNGVYLKVVSRL